MYLIRTRRPGSAPVSRTVAEGQASSDDAATATVRLWEPGDVRRIEASAPGPGEHSLRAAYLELLKLCLCDLAGAGTIGVGRLEEGKAYARELPEEQLQIRAQGLDWPLNGLTMTGLVRLDDLQSCIESVVEDGIEGDVIEAGVWRGGAAILMRATLDSLAAERTVWAADSFRGFRSRDAEAIGADSEGEDLSLYGFLSVPLADVRARFARLGLDRGVRFVPGYFEDTLPSLRGRTWSLVRLDGDTYRSTRVSLDCLYPGLSRGGYLIVDDYGALDECRRAVDDFRREHGIEEPLERIDWTCVRWKRTSDRGPPPAEGETLPPQVDEVSEAAPNAPATLAHIPTERELELERNLQGVRQRCQTLEAELGRLERRSLAGLARRLTARRRPGR
jgi:O-methyltransferase